MFKKKKCIPILKNISAHKRFQLTHNNLELKATFKCSLVHHLKQHSLLEAIPTQGHGKQTTD